MFSNEHMSVIDWWLFFILSIIPIVNIIVFIMILLSENANKSLKNYLLAIVLPGLILFGLMFILGPLSGFGPFR